jgi:hypothetical protein
MSWWPASACEHGGSWQPLIRTLTGGLIRRDMLALVRQAFTGRYEVEREIG